MHHVYVPVQPPILCPHDFAPDPELAMEFLYIDLAAGYKVIHALYAVAGITAVLVFWNFFSRRNRAIQTTSRCCEIQRRCGDHSFFILFVFIRSLGCDCVGRRTGVVFAHHGVANGRIPPGSVLADDGL